MKNKFAFTLAEVLITLVIIGVVAALTIPTAINKYRDEELKSQFKKVYSTISQALHKTEMSDFYGYAKCYYLKNANGTVIAKDECSAFIDAFVKNMQVQKTCKGNSLANGCIPVYQSHTTLSNCPGYNHNYMNNNNWSYVLSSGQIINFCRSCSVALFLVDINGFKGPNAYGKDLFSFAVQKDSAANLYITGSDCVFPVEGGKTTDEMIKYALIKK